MKKILIIEAHPREDSFCNSLADRYAAGAERNRAEVRILRLRDLDLEPTSGQSSCRPSPGGSSGSPTRIRSG